MELGTSLAIFLELFSSSYSGTESLLKGTGPMHQGLGPWIHAELQVHGTYLLSNTIYLSTVDYGMVTLKETSTRPKKA